MAMARRPRLAAMATATAEMATATAARTATAPATDSAARKPAATRLRAAGAVPRRCGSAARTSLTPGPVGPAVPVGTPTAAGRAAAGAVAPARAARAAGGATGPGA